MRNGPFAEHRKPEQTAISEESASTTSEIGPSQAIRISRRYYSTRFLFRFMVGHCDGYLLRKIDGTLNE